jgi:hypothetical protein
MERINFVQVIAKLALASALLYGAGSNAATQIVENGLLIGANRVDVKGVLYDVRFVQGTCPGAACQITFSNEADALDASTALLEQVTIDSDVGLFGTNPSLVRGPVFTPYQISSRYVSGYGGNGPGYYWHDTTYVSGLWTPNASPYFVGLAGFASDRGARSSTCDATNCTWSTLTQWTTSPVPLPATAFLFAPAICVFRSLRRRAAVV